MAAKKALRGRLGLALAIVLPALVAAVLVLTLADEEKPGIPGIDGPPARDLARLAELTPAAEFPSGAPRLLPVVAKRNTAGLKPQELEPISGGIRPAPPARISIPAADVDAIVDPVGAKGNGIVVPPLGRAGWFEGGPRPGEPGRAVVIGHLDTERGPGLFARVPRIPPGTSVSFTDGRGDVHRYNVVGTTQVHKRRFPAEAVYGPSEQPVLVLITCGGPYSPRTGYRDNVLVYARAA